MIQKEKATSIGIRLVISALLVLLFTFAATAMAAYLICTERLSYESMGVAGMLIVLLSSLLCGIVSKRERDGKGILMCIGSGGVYYLVLLCIGAAFDGVRVGIIPTACIVLAGSLSAGLLTIRGKHKIRYTIPKALR